METIRVREQNETPMQLGEVIERVLVESGLSISAFSRKVGYSRQYIYELLRSKDTGFARKIQLDTLKRICDATGYGLERLLTEIGYIPKSKSEVEPNTVIVVGKGYSKSTYFLDESGAALVNKVALAFAERRR